MRAKEDGGENTHEEGAETDKVDTASDDVAEHDEVAARETESLFTASRPTVGGPDHPSDLVTTTTLAYATPDIDGSMLHPSLCIPALSSAQREAVCLARARQLEGGALLIADGTGVGKGRELAGTFLNHLRFNPGANRFLFVTVSAALEADFRRDLEAVGWPLGKLPLLSLSGVKDDKVDHRFKKGILFVTYGLLRREWRLMQTISWF